MGYREEILEQALALPPADRAFVAAILQESLSAAAPTPADGFEGPGPETSSTSEFLAELQRRSAAYGNGMMSARPAADVIADLAAATE